MVRCPECGKELSSKDIVIPIFDPKHKLVGCFHVPNETWKQFLKVCEEKQLNPSDAIMNLIRSLIEAEKKS